MSKNQELTDWFPASQEMKPVRAGVYETRHSLQFIPLRLGYSYWSGTQWGNRYDTRAECEARRRYEGCGIQSKEWRGLAEQPGEQCQ